MMNNNVIFRSHLMQQFASAARAQSRPPIVLPRSSFTRRRTTASKHSLQQQQKQHQPPQTNHYQLSLESQKQGLATSSTAAIDPDPSVDSVDEPPERQLQSEDDLAANSSAIDQVKLLDAIDAAEHNQDRSEASIPISLASSFQSLLSSRRTVSHFMPRTAANQKSVVVAMDRAIVCAQNAPNHKRTEPFFFKRLLSDSIIHDLAEIAFQVALQRRKDRTTALELAERKRSKWCQVPAYIVTLVENQPMQVVDEGSEEDEDLQFEELPFIPPETERQLEDYASASAAVQNLLLSLHADHIGTKWATGPVIQTRAFRALIKARPTDRVVGLIMVGYYPAERKPRSSIRRRRTMEELVQDL